LKGDIHGWFVEVGLGEVEKDGCFSPFYPVDFLLKEDWFLFFFI
jgi:hypothetical protein